jgi:hypothetical protein
MDTRIPPTRPDVVTVPSEPRPTPTGTKFSDVLATGATSIVQGAESAMTILPGAPLMALAVRGGTTPAMPMGLGPKDRGPTVRLRPDRRSWGECRRLWSATAAFRLRSCKVSR